MEWKFSDFGYDKYLVCFHGKLGVKKLTSYRLVGEEDNKNTTTITKYKLKLETCTQATNENNWHSPIGTW